MSNFRCPMCSDCPDNCPLDTEEDTREHSADYYKGKADEQLRSIESAKEQAKEYRVALEKAKADEVRKFAEWLKKHCNSDGYIGRGRFDELLAEWQKGK